MLKRWLPVDRILKQAIAALIACILLAALAAGLGAYADNEGGRPERGRKAVAEAVSQYGPTSPEAADAIKQAGQSAGPQSVIALVDPSTGKAIAAWPQDLVGKTPDTITLPGGGRLPPLDRLLYRERFGVRQGQSEGAQVSVQVMSLYPWSGDEHGQRGYGGRPDNHGREGRFGKHRQPGPQAVAPTPAPAPTQPEAILLFAAPRPGITPVRIATGAAGALAALAFVIYWLSIAWWVFADARRRGAQAFAWGVLTLLTNLVGAAVYLVARQEQRNCPACGSIVERGFNHCPHCGHALKHVCAECGHQLKSGWTHCANCGTPYTPEA